MRRGLRSQFEHCSILLRGWPKSFLQQKASDGCCLHLSFRCTSFCTSTTDVGPLGAIDGHSGAI